MKEAALGSAEYSAERARERLEDAASALIKARRIIEIGRLQGMLWSEEWGDVIDAFTALEEVLNPVADPQPKENTDKALADTGFIRIPSPVAPPADSDIYIGSSRGTASGTYTVSLPSNFVSLQWSNGPVAPLPPTDDASPPRLSDCKGGAGMNRISADLPEECKCGLIRATCDYHR